MSTVFQFTSVDKPHAVSFDKSLAPVEVKFVVSSFEMALVMLAAAEQRGREREGKRAIQARERERQEMTDKDGETG